MEYLDDLDADAIQALAEMGVTFATNTSNATASVNTVSERLVMRRPRMPAVYLLRLEHPLSTPQDVATHLQLARMPKSEIGHRESGPTAFCRLDQDAVNTLDLWTASNFPKIRWTKIRINMAHKEDTMPLLGRNATFPQNRPSSLDDCSNISCGREYPIEYFFYGTLANTARLSRLWEIAALEVPPLRPATLLDGRICSWVNKYHALVDSPGEQVEGFACLVASVEQENALRRYEGDNYEVVSARFIVGGTEVQGRTFRFAGYEDELSG